MSTPQSGSQMGRNMQQTWICVQIQWEDLHFGLDIWKTWLAVFNHNISRFWWSYRTEPQWRNVMQATRAAISMKKAAEWQVWTFWSFCWVKDQFVYKEQGERRLILKMLSLLHNLHVKLLISTKYKSPHA